MSKIDIIDCCGDCSKKWYDGNNLRCDLTDYVIHESGPIPLWCPLEDYMEVENETIQKV